MRVLDDAFVREHLTPERAIAWLREVVLALEGKTYQAPPRVEVPLLDGKVVYTAGARTGRWYGYRSYDKVAGAEELVVAYDAASGRALGLAAGTELGPRRVGAMTALAVDALAPAGAATLGLLGAGRQAWAQLWAIRAVRHLDRVRVYARDPERREAFTRRARAELGLTVEAAASARGAVEGAGLVVLATSSLTPVIEASWVDESPFVASIGPKQVGASEFGPDLVTRAGRIVTDSLAQLDAYHPAHVAAVHPRRGEISALGPALSAGPATGVTLFLSVGLAGTEVALLARLLELP
ncbi:MAG: ornithine cyclodeaminase family protein [Myxococcales bacterium]|nr:ornithine cyclodeaminase family protein [Myxococcales bacterium]MCB9648858.1 ornithine cyclodeaminase family protein [Deltaproteobacteria bacterium]